jgi:nicotinamide mononucleotide transporter
VPADLAVQLSDAWRQTSWTEICAAVLAVLYLLLAIPQHVACWVAAFVSSCLYVWVLFGARLYMESSLNAFYAAMAVYGYLQWTRRRDGVPLQVRRWPLVLHLAGMVLVLLASSATAFLLRRYTPAAWPFVDSLITWSSVYATYLVARKVYENWHWWLAIDAVSTYLYFTRHLYVTMLLFLLYLVLIGVGMREWRRSLPQLADAAA